jgi:hypothetical protein
MTTNESLELCKNVINLIQGSRGSTRYASITFKAKNSQEQPKPVTLLY